MEDSINSEKLSNPSEYLYYQAGQPKFVRQFRFGTQQIVFSPAKIALKGEKNSKL